LPGLRYAMLVHQALLVTWCLSRHKCFHGGIIGDEQGLGKTFAALVLAYLNHEIERNFREVAEARDSGSSTHSTAGQIGLCLSGDKYPFVCSCEPGSPTAEFGYRSGPNLVIVPAPLMNNWCDEFKKLVDTDASDLELLIGHGTAPVMHRV